MSESTAPVEPGKECVACSRPIARGQRGLCSTCYSNKRAKAMREGAWQPRPKRSSGSPANWCAHGCPCKAKSHGICGTCYGRAHRLAVMSGVWRGKWTVEVAALLGSPTPPAPCEACGAMRTIEGALCGECRVRHPGGALLVRALRASRTHAAHASHVSSAGEASAFDRDRLAMLEACLGVLGPAIAATPPMLRSLLNDELPALIAAHRAVLEGVPHA